MSSTSHFLSFNEYQALIVQRPYLHITLGSISAAPGASPEENYHIYHQLFFQEVLRDTLKTDNVELMTQLFERGFSLEYQLNRTEGGRISFLFASIEYLAPRIFASILPRLSHFEYDCVDYLDGNTEKQSLLFLALAARNFTAMSQLVKAGAPLNVFNFHKQTIFSSIFFYPKEQQASALEFLLRLSGIETTFDLFDGHLNVLTMVLQPNRLSLFDILLDNIHNPRDTALFLSQLPLHKPHFVSFRNEYEEIFTKAAQRLTAKHEHLLLNETVPPALLPSRSHKI